MCNLTSLSNRDYVICVHVLAWVRPLRIRSLIRSLHACTCTVSPSLIMSFNNYEELHVDCFMIHDMLSSEWFSLSLTRSQSPSLLPPHTHTHRSLEPVVSATTLAVSAVWCVVSVLMVSPTLSPTLSRSTASMTTTSKLMFHFFDCSKCENNTCTIIP